MKGGNVYAAKKGLHSAPGGGEYILIPAGAAAVDLNGMITRSETVNGDRMAFGLREGRIWGFGIPIAGSSRIFCNRALPLGAVVLLEQGPENAVFRESPARALPFLLSQTTVNRWDGAFMEGVMELLGRLLEQLPVFRLRCRPDAGAVSCLRAALEAEAP